MAIFCLLLQSCFLASAYAGFTDAELFKVIDQVYDAAREAPVPSHCLEVRTDFTALLSVCRQWDNVIGVVYGIFLHGLFEEDAVRHVSKYMQPASTEKGALKILRQGLQAAREYTGKKTFPYQWLKNGDVYWKILMKSVRSIWKFAQAAVTHRRSWKEMDQLFPAICGPYSCFKGKKRASHCAYMRRHLTRFLTIYLHGFVQKLTPMCWDLACYDMGSGPKKATKLLGCSGDIDRAYMFANHIQARHGSRTYTLHSFVVFLCLNVAALQDAMNVLRSKQRSRCGKGVYMHTSGKYAAQITQDGSNISLGTFATQRDAKAARAAAISKIRQVGTFTKKVKKVLVKSKLGISKHRNGYQVSCCWSGEVHYAPKCSTLKAAYAARDKLFKKVGKPLHR
jgi:hypothetical protein